MKDKIQAKLKEAMLARDTFLTDVLKGLKSAILYEEVAKGKREEGLSEDEVISVVSREVKKRNDSVELYAQAGNQELADKEKAECEILMQFLPEQMSEDEIVKLIEEVITEINPDGMKDMGRVIGAVKVKAGATADGAVIAKIVKEKLAN